MQDFSTDLLQKEMSRKEFLATVGYGLASLVGVAGVLRLFGHKGFSRSSARHGYGSSPYGI